MWMWNINFNYLYCKNLYCNHDDHARTLLQVLKCTPLFIFSNYHIWKNKHLVCISMRALWYRFEFRHRQPKQKGQTSCKPNMQFTLDKHFLRSQWWKVYNQYLSSLDCKMEIWSSIIFHLSSSTNGNFCAMATTAPEAMLYSFLRHGQRPSCILPTLTEEAQLKPTRAGAKASVRPSLLQLPSPAST